MLENLNVMHLKSWHYARLILVYMFDTLFLFPSPQTKAYLHKSEHKNQVNRAWSRTFSHDNWQALATWLDYILYYARCFDDSIAQNYAGLIYLALAPLRRGVCYYTMFMNNLFRGVVNDSLDRTTSIVVIFVYTEPECDHDSFLAFSIGSIKQNQNYSLNSC